MHEKRNFAMVLLLVAGIVWSIVAWIFLADDAPLRLTQRVGSIMLVVSMSLWLFYALRFEDKIPDRLGQAVGDVYYDVDGISFMPTIRATDGQAELCVFYQNRYENPAQVIVHLRPPADSFIIRPNMRDVHFAFKAGGGDFGVIHQPIAVPEHLQGEVIDIELAAATHYPRSHGARWLKHAGLPCGTLPVDWGGSVFRTGVREVSGEINLAAPAHFHLSMPPDVLAYATGDETWRQERLAAGPSEA